MDDVVAVLTLAAREATVSTVFFCLATKFPVVLFTTVASIVVVGLETSTASVLSVGSGEGSVEAKKLLFGLTEALALVFINKLSVDIMVVSVVLNLVPVVSSSFAAAAAAVVIVFVDSSEVSLVVSTRRSVCTTVNNC